MRLVIQRVSSATVKLEDKLVGSINSGLLVLLGIENGDDLTDVIWLVNKMLNLRIFNDDNGKMNKNIQEINGEVLVVSQFTLYADTKKGNRPSFIRAAKPEMAIDLYSYFIEQLQRLVKSKIKTGKFGADMKLKLINDGPVTIILEK